MSKPMTKTQLVAAVAEAMGGDKKTANAALDAIAERYPSRDAYLGRIAQAAVTLVRDRYLLAEDVADLVTQAGAHWDWATATR